MKNEVARKKVHASIGHLALINKLPPDEQKIARTLSTDFYITGGFKEIQIGQSTYRYFFLKFPDDKASSRSFTGSGRSGAQKVIFLKSSAHHSLPDQEA